MCATIIFCKAYCLYSTITMIIMIIIIMITIMIIIVIIRNNVPLFQAFLLNKLKPTCVLCGVSLVVVFSGIGNFIRSIENILIVLAAFTLFSSIPDWIFLKCSLILFAKSDWSDCCETWRGDFSSQFNVLATYHLGRCG